MRRIRYRLYDGHDGDGPRVGHYIMSRRGRGAYLVLGVKDRGRRGGLGEPVYHLFAVDVERVPRAEGDAAIPAGIVHGITWDSRRRKPRQLVSA
jgi:hypothetical protein